MMLSKIIEALPDISGQHARNSRVYAMLERAANQAIRASQLTQTEDAHINLGGFGKIYLPYHNMGAIDTFDLFGLDELIIFSFYWSSRHRYKRAADIGANLGLHSILMSRCGWQVNAYEPDPIHAKLLRRNLKLNDTAGVDLIEAAVSDTPGTLEFVRVLGNTTGSHLSGAKASPYGKLERFPVTVLAINDIMSSVDFVKMDAEGQEKTIILATNADHWRKTDMMVEVGSAENAHAIFEHLKMLGVNAFSQKLGWQQVVSLEDMATSYKEGSLFLSTKSSMPWAE
jgi:FkbM family methyltransferase